MPLLITLAVACSAFYVAKVAKEEMVGIFAAIVAFISFALSLVLAPWFAQSSILLFVLLWQASHR
ncbi:MAG: hypothetical protein KME27_29010 [Lyngbya sp. HA4199-MV5]|jgi:hypothetical protein|nr:hypothetical protein [Lyngbya sp. HA4199-MV5]